MLWHLEEIEFTFFTPLAGGEKSAIFLLFNNKPRYLLLYTNSYSHYWGCLWLYKLCFWHGFAAGLVVL